MAKLKFKRLEGGVPTLYYVPMSLDENDTYVLESGTIANSLKLNGLTSAQFLRSDVGDRMTGLLDIKRDGEMLRLTNVNTETDSWIGIGHTDATSNSWRLKYVGSTTGTGGNELRIESTQGKYYQFDHDGHFEYWDGSTMHKVWTGANGGVGSGLHADILDGYHETSFGRLDAARTWMAAQRFDGGLVVDTNSGAKPLKVTRAGNTETLDITREDSTATFHIIEDKGELNSTIGTFLFKGSQQVDAPNPVTFLEFNQLKFNYMGNKVFHEGYMGVGSGLDAEKLGGIDHGEYIKGVNGTGTIGLQTGDNANSITKAGFYRAKSGTANIPSTYGSLIHVDHESNGDYYGQIFLSDGGDSKAFFRTKQDGNTWNTLYSTNNKPSKADVGLGNLPNTISDDYSTNSSSILASTKAVNQLKVDILNNVDGQYDTLYELQQAIEGNDTDITTILNGLSHKVEKGGDTMTGILNIDHGAGGLNIKPGSDDKAYMGLYARTADKGVRSGFLGFGVAGSDNLAIYNEATSTYLSINETGVNTNRHYTESGVRLYSPSNKPSASALGVLPTTGGAMTGDINFSNLNQGIYFKKGTEEAYIKASASASSLDIGSDQHIYFRETDTETSKIHFDMNTAIYDFTGTLKENNSRVWTTSTFDPATKLSLTGGTMSGGINMGGNTISNINRITGFNGHNVIKSYDSWLRINDGSDPHSQGVYCGLSVLRTDGEIQVGSSGTNFKVSPTGVVTAKSSITANEKIRTEQHIEIQDASIKYNTTTKSISFVF